MPELLRANFSRLWKDKIFLIEAAVMAVAGLSIPFTHYIDNIKNNSGWTAEEDLFTYVFLVPILISVFTALFIGCEYSDGTMRNKLIAGHRRSHIYIANLMVCIVAAFILCAAYIVPYLCTALPLLGKFGYTLKVSAVYTALSFALTATFTSVFTLVAMLCRNRAYTAAGCILISFALLFAGVSIVSALNEPEYFGAYSYTENGQTVSGEAERNPNYLSGTKREIYEFLYDFTPGGQAIQLSGAKAEKPARLAAYDGIILLVTAGIGTVFFKRKDLK